MKSLSVFRLLGLLALLIGLAGIPLYGQGQQPASQDPAAQTQSPPDQQEPAAQSQSPSGQQQQPSARPEPSQQEPGAQSQESESPQSAESQPTQIFVGKVAKAKGGLMLKGDTGMSYKLDNVDQAKPFVGKSVKVTGTLDATTNTIHVTTIEPASSS